MRGAQHNKIGCRGLVALMSVARGGHAIHPDGAVLAREEGRRAPSPLRIFAGVLPPRLAKGDGWVSLPKAQPSQPFIQSVCGHSAEAVRHALKAGNAAEFSGCVPVSARRNRSGERQCEGLMAQFIEVHCESSANAQPARWTH